jgi:hypothetical protein
MSKYDTIAMIKTECDSLFEIKDLVAYFFIENRDEEEVTVRNFKNGVQEKELKFSIYASDIVKLINAHLQIAHFGGTLESA